MLVVGYYAYLSGTHRTEQQEAVMSEIDTALKEQSAANELIAKQVEVIASMSEENTAAMSEAKQASSEMKRLSTEMDALGNRFRV